MDANPAGPGFGALPEMPVAGSVADEEAVSIEQIAAVTRWLRHFSSVAPTPAPTS